MELNAKWMCKFDITRDLRLFLAHNRYVFEDCYECFSLLSFFDSNGCLWKAVITVWYVIVEYSF